MTDDLEAEIEEFRKAVTAAAPAWRETLALVEIAVEIKRLNARLDQSVSRAGSS
jgi:hypothetical protein